MRRLVFALIAICFSPAQRQDNETSIATLTPVKVELKRQSELCLGLKKTMWTKDILRQW
jgi:hypothetical protein